jgi:hypothetical protein
MEETQTAAEAVTSIGAVGISLIVGIVGVVVWFLREAAGIVLDRWRRYMAAPPGAVAANRPKADDDEDSGVTLVAQHPTTDGGPQTSALTPTTPRTDTFKNRFKIEEHYFFATTDYLVAHRVPQLECGCPVRTEMLRDMLTIYIREWRSALEAFCSSEVHKEGFESKAVGYGGGFANRINKLMLDLKPTILKTMSSSGVPQTAILALSEWEAPWIEVIAEHTDKVARGSFVQTNRERLIVILTLHITYLSTVLMEAKYALQRINGGLDGQLYKGNRISPVQHPHGPTGDDRALTKKQRSGEHRAPK